MMTRATDKASVLSDLLLLFRDRSSKSFSEIQLKDKKKWPGTLFH